MLKTAMLTVAAGAITALFAFDAGALPVTTAGPFAAASDVTLVRDGCGRGMRYSNRRDTCVEQHNRGPQVRVYRDNRSDYNDADDAVDTVQAIGGIIGALTGGGRHNHRGW